MLLERDRLFESMEMMPQLMLVRMSPSPTDSNDNGSRTAS